GVRGCHSGPAVDLHADRGVEFVGAHALRVGHVLVEPELIDQVYEAAAIPELWPTVIERIAKLTGSVGGVLFSVTPNYSGWTSSPAYAPLFSDFIAAGWHTKNARAERAVARDYPGFIGDNELFTSEEMDQSPMYDWLRRKNFGWCFGTVIKVPAGDT